MLLKTLFTLLVGAQCSSMLEDVGKIRIETFKDYPFLYEGNQELEQAYLKVYTNEESAIVKATVDGQLAGFITGVPLAIEANVSEKAAADFKQQNYNHEEFYYIGEVIVLPEYRKQKIGTALFEKIEQQAAQFGYENFCLVGIEHAENHPLKPDNYEDPEIFCQKMGYKKTEIKMPAKYPTICADGSVKEVENTFVFWVKEKN